MRKQKIAVSIAVVMWGVASGASALTSAPTDTVKGRVPTLTGVSFNYVDVNNNGRVDVGDSLKIEEQGFDDPDMDAQAPSEYKWYRDGIDMGVTGDSYTLTLADLGTQITAGVIPQTDATTTDPYQGNEVAAAGGSPDGDGSVDVVQPTEVDAVDIVIDASGDPLTGNPIVATTLKAKITTSAGGVGVASDYNYTWQIEDVAGSGNYINIASAVSETYTPSKDDQKRKLRVDVTKK